MLNEQTLEFGQAVLKAKNALRFSSRTIGKRLGYIVEDELTGKFFQIGLSQYTCLLYTSPSPRDLSTSRMPSSA